MVLQSVAHQTPTAKASEPILGTDLIPKERYVSKEFMDLEWERMWTKVWNIAGREQDIANIGDYFTTELGPESFLVVREAEDRVRAFYNVCPHRGNQIRNPGMGHAESFQCAYHFFEFNLDGSKKFVPDEDTFTQGVPQETALIEVPCDTWGGWVWFNMNPEAEPLREFLGEIPEHLDPYHFDEQYIVQDRTIEWDCNWKTSVDAFNEVYHVQGIHPQILENIDDIHVQIDLYERHNRYLVPFGLLSPRYPNQTELTRSLKEMLHAAGIDSETFKGGPAAVRPAIQKKVKEHAATHGIDLSDLNDDQLTDDYHYYLFPNITLNTHHSGVMLFRQRPHASDPNKMYYDLQSYVRIPEGSDPPPRPIHTTHKHGEISLGLGLDQDSYNLPRVQKGMNSRSFKGLLINYRERRIRHMHKVIDDYLDGPDR
ncbi:MAG TPA: (2Fe-2S)-binding protein [Dehalococcoidia bacterium]|nr:(2Fe-2S)-binding protein [Dehalococcoidia bacterium]|tara:strand:- start:486 stop:1766 length:1281 start_codon:yes stop_codon:yes gene_type:complete